MRCLGRSCQTGFAVQEPGKSKHLHQVRGSTQFGDNLPHSLPSLTIHKTKRLSLVDIQTQGGDLAALEHEAAGERCVPTLAVQDRYFVTINGPEFTVVPMG